MFTLAFAEVAPNNLPRVGGKGANLGVLTRAGLPVPPGFCVTTEAYARFLSGLEAEALFAALDRLDGSDIETTRKAATAMRAALAEIPIPKDVEAEILSAWETLGTAARLAVRSSATAEDLPGASFAGQQDTYLNIRGMAALLDAVRRCWISLFTDRAVLYRAKNGFGHRRVQLSVVVQELVDPQVSGIMFTADPVSGHRGVTSIDAGFGLGEALVGGLISADLYKVDREHHTVIEATPGDKAFAIRALPDGGTRQEALPENLRKARALNDQQVLALADLGERISQIYGGTPQDIEWCIADEKIAIVQARPITSLFPIPLTKNAGPGAFMSFGHFQMMTNAMPRLAMEVWQYFFPAGKGRPHGRPKLSPYMVSAASRLYIDVTVPLRSVRSRAALAAVLGYAYADLGKNLVLLASRPAFARVHQSLHPIILAALRILGPVLCRVPGNLLLADPVVRARTADRGFNDFAASTTVRIKAAKTPGDRIRQCAVELDNGFSNVRVNLAPMVAGVAAHRILAGSAKKAWADDVRDQVDRLLRGLPGGVTTEMDLKVGDLADIVRPHEALAKLLQAGEWNAIRAQLPVVEGGPEFLQAMEIFVARYGDRGAGEIDISRIRWRDNPSMLLRVINGGSKDGAHRQQFAQQVKDGQDAQRQLVEAAGRGAFGFLRRAWVRRLCRVARFGMGLREHPKFAIVRLLGVVHTQALEAGALLAERKQINSATQVWHLSFEELAQALDTPGEDLREELDRRQAQFRLDQQKKPPIVISSEGETPTLAHDVGDFPKGAMRGTGASSGVVEGIARVIRDPDREVLHAGEILVAPFTDPGWTPLFVHAAAVVTEVGGALTHGAVVAREYGIPAVVSVAGATDRIRTGQRIRVDGTRGFVQIVEEP